MRTLSNIVIASSALLFTLLGVINAKDSCKALAMSGGANKGAYEAGVIYQMAHSLNNSEVDYDVVTGVSAGAINAGGISLWPAEKQLEMSEWLVDTWLNLTADKAYKNWPLGFVQGLFLESGYYNNQPMVDYITGIFNQFGAFQRKITVAAVDVNTGEYVTFNDNDEGENFEDFPLKIIASASVPFVFPHRHIGDRIFMDGGTTWNTNLISAIERCMEVVDHPSKITIDIIICSSHNIASENKTASTIGNFLRYRDIKSFNSGLEDITGFARAYPDVNFRYFFMPSEPLTSGLDELKFEKEVLQKMIDVGKKDVLTVLNQTQGQTFEKLFQWVEEPEVRKQHKNLAEFIHLN